MKSTTVTLLFLVAFAFSYAQSEDTLKPVKVEPTLLQPIQSPTIAPAVESVLKHDYELLERKLTYSEFIISSLNTAITIIAVLFGFLLPLLSYVFVIKPQNELKKTLTKNIQKFLEEQRSEVLKEAFKVLNAKSSSEMERRLALDDLENSMSYPPKQSELLKTIHVLEDETYPNIRQDLHFILVEKKHSVVEAFYAKQWKEETVDSGSHFANVYFCNYPDNAVQRLVPILKAGGVKATAVFFKLYDEAVAERNKTLLRDLVSSEDIADAIVGGHTPDTAGVHFSLIIFKLKELGFPEEDIPNFILVKKLSEVSSLTDQHRGVHKPSDLK